MRFLLLALMVAVCAFSALAEDDYFPMNVGDEWTLAVTYVSATGEVSEGLIHRKMNSAINRDGKTYYQLRTWTEGLPQKIDTLKLVRHDEKAVYSIDARKDGAIEQVDFLLPLKVGTTWNRTTNTAVAVIGLDPVEIGGKHYENCFHVRSTNAGTQMTEDFWLAPNIGNFKSLLAFGSGVKVTTTLKEFKPGK